MQSKGKKKPVQEVHKPILTGSWHGRDAWTLAGKRALSMPLLAVGYLLIGLLLGFNSLWARILICLAVVSIAFLYQYSQGMTRGQADCAFAEIMYEREKSGREVPPTDRERCFHPAKGFFAFLAGSAPYVLFALVFAFLTKPASYVLGVLPSWTAGMLHQSEFGDALRYYNVGGGIAALDVMRMIDRAMMMPFVNVATAMGDNAVLWAERLSPLLILIAPSGYGFGYAQGLKLRARINTGIKMGDDKKKRRERKARRQRQRSNTPERLI